MAGLFNINFMVGYLLAKDNLPKNDALRAGLMASQFPQNNNLVGTVMLKTQIDHVKETEEKRDKAEEIANSLRLAFEQMTIAFGDLARQFAIPEVRTALESLTDQTIIDGINVSMEGATSYFPNIIFVPLELSTTASQTPTEKKQSK